MQILINLIGNAKHAIRDADTDDGQIQLRIVRKENWVILQVTDNGVGITPDNLEKIFRHGFTTKKDGHGFGLHSAVLAAKEMGGSLTASSNGAGTGATFTLKLPLTSKAEKVDESLRDSNTFRSRSDRATVTQPATNG